MRAKMIDPLWNKLDSFDKFLRILDIIIDIISVIITISCINLNFYPEVFYVFRGSLMYIFALQYYATYKNVVCYGNPTQENLYNSYYEEHDINDGF